MSVNFLTTIYFTNNTTWVPPDYSFMNLILIGGGGGGGGGGMNTGIGNGGNGGNAGQILYLNNIYGITTVNITVGVGGIGGTGICWPRSVSTGFPGSSGTDTIFGTFLAQGGSFGYGGNWNVSLINTLNNNTQIGGMYNTKSDIYITFTGLLGAQNRGFGTSSIASSNSYGFLIAPTGGGSGGCDSNFIYTGLPSGYIYNPFLAYSSVGLPDPLPSLVNRVDTASGATGLTYNSFFGTGGNGSSMNAIATINLIYSGGFGGQYGGGGGGGCFSPISTTNIGTNDGNAGQNGLVIVSLFQ